MAGTIPAKSQLGKLGLRAAKEHSSDIYMYAGRIDEQGYEALRNEVLFARRSEKAILILVTNGGSGSAAFKIARLFQTFYDSFDIFVPAHCKSAGTLLALGANRLWMSPFAELGPIDAQGLQRDELGVLDSSLSTRTSLEAIMETSFSFFNDSVVNLATLSQGSISFRLAAEICGAMATNIMSPLVARIDPAVLGREKRDVEQGIKYGSQLASISGNADEDTVVSLAQDYPYHGFVIDFAHAKTLFRQVKRAEGTLLALGNELGDAIRHASEGDIEIKTLHKTKLSNAEEATSQGMPEIPADGFPEMTDYCGPPGETYADWLDEKHQANDDHTPAEDLKAA
ncbi:hypothetical protein [Mesorhizobium sp. M0239]|uniref:SDH family Clp fold serine proteinase n=1 Tax=Mesorhizobium sp. M0239 TaxID=2956924 RepID=UPI0033374E28